MTPEQFIEAKDLENYIHISMHNRTSSSPIKSRRLEALYVELTGDEEINRGCTSCMLDKIMPRILVEISEHKEVPSETQEDNESYDIGEFIKLHHNTQKKKIDQISDIETLELIMESTPHQSVKDHIYNKLSSIGKQNK